MKAVYCTGYGGPEVLEIRDLPVPQPKANEILIRNRAASVTRADTMLRQGTPFFGRLFIGLFKPKNPLVGTGFSGVVEAVGDNVTRFSVGQEVYGETLFNFASNAEFVCIPEDGVVMEKPKNMGFDEAASLCDGALTSLNFLNRVAVLKEGQHILINGAAGALGSAAVQLAKEKGAEVTAVCSEKNADFVRNLGADHVIDYHKKSFASNKGTYDMIYDCVGKSSFGASKKALKKGGVYMSPVLNIPLLFQVIKTSVFGQKKARFAATGTLKPVELKKLLGTINGLIEKNRFKSVVDRTYAIDEIKKAHTYLDSGRKKANIALVF